MDATWRILPLTAEYTRSLAECHIACWREAYRGLVPDHVLDAFDIDRLAEQTERLRVAHPRLNTIAVVEDEVIGFAREGAAMDDSVVTPRQLFALYVRAAWYGTGVAHDLMRAVLAEDADTSLWVFEENPRAQAFYKKYGFELDGERRVEAFTPALEVRMVRRVTGAR
ncbi:GNAT family N-acetyltransferase [Nocardia sp. NPDC127526]|uniref:GNAT family N-acetyltransferase n=1 Tax=Nocardia sp. NPDC127526 TaxID=3345393 RepID=UPI00362DDF3B